MIDQSINEVFQRDKKVFIPDFGAIIYSEITDSIDFNDLLNFDDGKIIAEIQEKQNVPEEEARSALSEHVSDISKALNQGNLHFIEGIGYLAKDAQGSITIQDTAASSNLNSDQEEVLETKPVDTNENQEQTEDSTETSDSKLDKKIIEEKNEKETLSTPKVELDEEQVGDENPEIVSPETELIDHPVDEYSYKPVLSEENEDVQEYYKRKEEFYRGDKKRSPLRIVLWVVISLILLASTGYYYFNYYLPREVQSNENLQQSQLSHTVAKENPVEQDAKQVLASQVIDDKKDENESSSTSTNADAPLSNQQTDQADSPSSIDSQTTSSGTGNQNKIYSLIIGSFEKKLNADKFQQKLLGQGMDVDVFRRGNNYYFVGIEQIAGKSKAVNTLNEIKEKQPSAWIIRKK